MSSVFFYYKFILSSLFYPGIKNVGVLLVLNKALNYCTPCIKRLCNQRSRAGEEPNTIHGPMRSFPKMISEILTDKQINLLLYEII